MLYTALCRVLCVLRFSQVLAAHGIDRGTQASVGSGLHGDRMCPLRILASWIRACGVMRLPSVALAGLLLVSCCASQ
ncbi:hypothetical protein XF_0970 [Xylella fastidiosa 9a5c]|uniref:Secreted protein n=1 Tax=Xylella fastidiosa (strain 9a5c) TaxID=160492 RepID=Q9PEQ8_XYLFA|nr:hypothetical protein XF_0970 [Xylella fastidiosa 9a5c]